MTDRLLADLHAIVVREKQAACGCSAVVYRPKALVALDDGRNELQVGGEALGFFPCRGDRGEHARVARALAESFAPPTVAPEEAFIREFEKAVGQ